MEEGWGELPVAVLKILVSYPDGFAVMTDLKRDMAILATSGRDWAERTTRLAARVPGLDIFSQVLVEPLNGGWRITEQGRAMLELMEARPAETGTESAAPAVEPSSVTAASPPLAARRLQHEGQASRGVAPRASSWAERRRSERCLRALDRGHRRARATST